MFSSDMKENLIKELNLQLAKNEFYKSDEVDISLDDIGTKHNLTYANLASIPKYGITNLGENVESNKVNYYLGNNYSTNVIKSVGMFKPLVNFESNPLTKNVYNYDTSYKVSVNGMVFNKDECVKVDNPLTKPCNIVNKSFGNVSNGLVINDDKSFVNDKQENALKAYKSSNEYLDFDSLVERIDEECDDSKVLIKPVAANTYEVSDILAQGNTTQVLNLSTFPDNMALTKQSKFRSFWFKQIDVLGGIKNLFHSNKVKVK